METTPAITRNTRTSRGQRRENGKCKLCGAHHTRIVDVVTETTTRSDMIKAVGRKVVESVNGGPVRAVECCGAHVWMRAVKGTRNEEIKCGPKCWSSKGHVCECSCGGKNHGAGAPAV